MKNSILKHVKRLIPWIRVNVADPDGNVVSELTLQYEDNFELERARYFKLTDEQFLLIQLAISTVALIYKDNPVGCIGTIESNGDYICGDDFIELLSDLNDLRKAGGDGTYLRLREVLKTFDALIEQTKSEDPGKTLLKKPDRVAKHFWNKALNTLSEYVKEFKKQAKQKKL